MSERTCLEELLQTDEGGLRTNEGGRGGEGRVESEGVEVETGCVEQVGELLPDFCGFAL